MTPEKKQVLRLTAAFGVLMFLIVSLVVFSPLKNYALAYLNSYSKNDNDLLTKDMWNSLDDDFGLSFTRKVCTPPNNTTYIFDCQCPANTKVISGGCNLNGTGGFLNSSFAVGVNSWRCESEPVAGRNVEEVQVWCISDNANTNW